MFVFLPTDYHCNEVEVIRSAFPRSIQTEKGQREFPYTLEMIVSTAVKVSSVVATNGRRDNEFNQFAKDMRFHLKCFDALLVEELIRRVGLLVQFLASKCLEYGWYNDDGESPYRFADWKDGTSRDIMLATH